MKKYTLFLLPIIFSLTVHATSAVNPKDHPANQIITPSGDDPFIISLDDYLNLSPKKYREITGRKLTLKEKIKLKISQSVLKKALKKNGILENKMLKRGLFDPWSWHWGGFALGFFFSILGVVVALFINDDYKHDRIMTALTTAGIMAGVLLAIATALSPY